MIGDDNARINRATEKSFKPVRLTIFNPDSDDSLKSPSTSSGRVQALSSTQGSGAQQKLLDPQDFAALFELDVGEFLKSMADKEASDAIDFGDEFAVDDNQSTKDQFFNDAVEFARENHLKPLQNIAYKTLGFLMFQTHDRELRVRFLNKINQEGIRVDDLKPADKVLLFKHLVKGFINDIKNHEYDTSDFAFQRIKTDFLKTLQALFAKNNLEEQTLLTKLKELRESNPHAYSLEINNDDDDNEIIRLFESLPDEEKREYFEFFENLGIEVSNNRF